MPTIRVDDDVYAWLQSHAKPFEDSPNSVLRKVAGLNARVDAIPTAEASFKETHTSGSVLRRSGSAPSPEPLGERLTGDRLRERWKVPVRHALYHRDGTFYENLEQFPGALFDPNGYVVFKTAEEYRRSPHLRIGQKLNVPGGIASIAGYVRMRDRGAA